MKNIKIIDNLNDTDLHNCVLTIGTFDGVHTGHRFIFDTLNSVAKQLNTKSVVLTFHPHPRAVIFPEKKLQLLNTIDEKIELIHQSGIDLIAVIPFTKEFSNTPFEFFVETLLIKELEIKGLVIGYDQHFGKNREGNYENLIALSEKYGFHLERVNPFYINDKLVSSTLIRNAIFDSDFKTANYLLGYDFTLTGQVVMGKQIGRTIGFPTANVKVKENTKMLPNSGVYIVDLVVDNTTYHAMMNIGRRPTIDDTNQEITFEVHVLNQNLDLYQKFVTIKIKQKLRDEIKFDSLQSLVNQLNIDKNTTLEYFKL